MALTEAQKRKIEEEENYRAKLRGALSQGVEERANRNRIAAALVFDRKNKFGRNMSKTL